MALAPGGGQEAVAIQFFGLQAHPQHRVPTGASEMPESSGGNWGVWGVGVWQDGPQIEGIGIGTGGKAET